MILSKNAIIAIASVAVIAVAGIGAAIVITGDNDAGNNYPAEGITITTFTDYNGNTANVTFSKVPERVVCGCNTALNLLLYLGLGDNIIGCYYNEEPIWEENQAAYDELCKRIGAVDVDGSKNISKNIKTDTLLSWQPDLVIGWVSWNSQGLGTEEFWNDNGCNVMSLNTMTSNSYRNLTMMKTDYDNIGKIFNVYDRTTKLYNDTIDVVNRVTAQLAGKETVTYALVDGAVNTDKGTIWFYKNSNFIASVLNGMGMSNVFPDGGTVGLADVYEVIGTSDIDMIIYITYGSVTYEKSLKSWQDDADLSKCAAIKDGHTMKMFLSCSYGSTPQLLDALQDIADFVSEIQKSKA